MKGYFNRSLPVPVFTDKTLDNELVVLLKSEKA